ncbi:MAG TPA: hypothetical protein VNA69_24335 [Thermoanaerobaculia bacterium]|nr:hypothetical protein [Thermoanaerobaculia bacterium]
MLKGTYAAVQKGVAAGKTVDQLKEEKVLAQWDSWGAGFIKADFWIETLFKELSARTSSKKE